MVSVRKMQADEAGQIAAVAKEAASGGAVLASALASHPERVRVVHMGHELLGAFVLAELEGGVEEISGLALRAEGLSAGAERAVVEYVVGAARFARKRAVEVVAHPHSPESRHLEREGFRPSGQGTKDEQRYRIDVKKPGGPRVSASAPSPKEIGPKGPKPL